MKIFKNRYGWSTAAHSKTKENGDIKCYLDTQFGRHSEPSVESIEGDLVFREKNGREWTAFFSSYMTGDGRTVPKMVLLPMGSGVQETLTGDGIDVLGHIDHNIKVEEEDLPFY